LALRPESGTARIIFLDVGQGDCALILYRGASILIDAGPATAGYDAGEWRIAPELRKHGVTRIDLVLLSHPDQDHVGGFPSLARRYPVSKVLAPKTFQRHPDMLKRLEEARIDERRVSWVGRAEVKVGDLRLIITTPESSVLDNDNEGSMFVRAELGQAAAVFTGDAGIDTELRMMRHLGARAQILKAGHHGSRGSTSRGLLERLRPQWVVISCGANNRYGHPHPETLARIQEAGATALRTDELGSIAFDLGSQGLRRVDASR